MAPFLINHPMLIHAWINARETALARVRSMAHPDRHAIAKFEDLLARAALNAESWNSDHPLQVEKVAALRNDLAKAQDATKAGLLETDFAWNALMQWAEANLSLEGQEQIASLMLEPYGDIIDDLASTMCADEASHFRIDGSMRVSRLQALNSDLYGWAQDTPFSEPQACANVWYTSEEKLEPRLGKRFEEMLDDYEQPLAPARDAMAMLDDLAGFDAEAPIAEFLISHPQHRHMVRRIQMLAYAPYGEIRDNTIAADMLPIDLLRCKLSFFGANKFDPRSDRWVRITMYQHAPYPDELAAFDPDECVYPASAAQ